MWILPFTTTLYFIDKKECIGFAKKQMDQYGETEEVDNLDFQKF